VSFLTPHPGHSTLQKAARNLQKAREVEEKAERVEDEAANMASMAKKLRQNFEKKWF